MGTGDHKPGTHAFRRYGNTCPKGFRDYWLGHAGNTMDELYNMVNNAPLGKRKAAAYGVGLSFRRQLYRSMVPNVPKKGVKAVFFASYPSVGVCWSA